MQCWEGRILQLVALLSGFAYALSHTVYRFPDKQQVIPHQHPHPNYNTHNPHNAYNTHPPQQPQQQQYHQGGYQASPKPKHADRSAPYSQCQYNGDILKNPHDRCSYLECHYGEEPWYNRAGKGQLYARVRQCPPGTAVAKDAKHVIFRPIQYDPTRRVYQGQPKGYENQGYGYQGYKKQPSYEYKNTYDDMTAICSQVSDASSCKGY